MKMNNAASDLLVEIVDVTPDMAKGFLARSSGNRSMGPRSVKRYSQDMISGRFLTYHPMGFTVSGRLIDGHNRCQAIIEAGVAVKTVVIRDLPEEIVDYIDQGVARTDKHVIEIFGLEADSGMVSMSKRMLCGIKNAVDPTRNDRIAFFKKHLPALRFVRESVPLTIKKLTVAPVLAPVARAWYTQDRGRLAEFCRILITGEPQQMPEDQAVIALREWLMRPLRVRHGREASTEMYAKTETALRLFLDRRSVGKLQAAKLELFLLPEELAA